MSDCQHEDFNASVEINRLSDTEDGPVNSLAIELRVQCASCGKPVRSKVPLGWRSVEVHNLACLSTDLNFGQLGTWVTTTPHSWGS